MQYLHEIQHHVSSIDKFLNISKFYRYEKFTDVSGSIRNFNGNEVLSTYRRIVINTPFLLPNGDCIVYINNRQTNIIQFTLNRIFLVKHDEPGVLYEILPINLAVAEDIDDGREYRQVVVTDQFILDAAFKELSTLIMIDHLKNLLKTCVVSSSQNDTIKYTNGAYYIGSVLKSNRTGFGTFVMKNDVIFTGMWNDDGTPLGGYIYFYSNNVRIVMYMYLLDKRSNSASYLCYIDEKQLQTHLIEKNFRGMLIYISDNIIITGDYLVILDTVEIVHLNKTEESYKFTKQSKFVCGMIKYGNKTIVRDIYYSFVFESSETSNLLITMCSNYKNSVAFVDLRLSYDSFMYKIYDYKSEPVTDIVSYNTPYDVINAIGDDLFLGFRICNNKIYIEENTINDSHTTKDRLNNIEISLIPSFNLKRQVIASKDTPTITYEIDNTVTPKCV